MDQVSLTRVVALCLLLSTAWAQDAPDKVYGTKDGEIELFAPADVLRAGATAAEGTYRFFAHEPGSARDITSNTNIVAGTGLDFSIVPNKTYTDGLQFGPFHTTWEGTLDIQFTRGQNVTMAVSVIHTFANGKKLTTTRSHTFRLASTNSDIPLSDFASITQLEAGTVRADDGTDLVITAALLEEPVDIEITANIDCARNCTLSGAEWEIEAVTFWQLRDPILAVGGSGGGPPLSNAVPKVESGTGAAGVATAASRGDHVHPAAGGGGTPTPLSDQTPKDLGTANAGTATAASRGDHVHKLPTQIATNTRAIAAKPDLTDDEPKAVGNAARVGTGTEAARNDHAHQFANYGASIKNVASASSAGVLDQVARVDHVHGGGGGGGGGATEFTELTDTPANYTGSAGKVPAVNADEDQLAFIDLPPDLTDELEDAVADIENNTADLEALDFLTQDITAGVPSTDWATVSDTSNAGIALFSTAANCTQARAATYATGFATGAGNKASIVRIKTGFARANVRVEVKGRLATETYEDLLTGWSLLCTSADGTFGYYHELYADGVVAFGADVVSAQVQTTGGAHIGTSSYSGDPAKVERWAIDGNATHIPIDKMLPSPTGHAGNVLTVNSAATGVEWKAAGSEGGGSNWQLIGTVTQVLSNSSDSNFYFTSVVPNTGIPLTEMFANAFAETHEFLVTVSFNGQSWPFYAWGNEGLYGPGDDATSAVAYRWTTTDDALDGPYANNALAILTFYHTPTTNARNNFRIITTTARSKTVKVDLYQRVSTTGGGSGGSSGPSLPNPSAAGALQLLRVNAAGSAYELSKSPTGVPDCTDCEHDVLVRTDDGGINWSDRLSEIDQPSFAETASNHRGQLLAIESCGDDGEKIACKVGYNAINETQWDKIDEQTITGIGGTITYTIAARDTDDVFTLMQAGAASAFHSFVLYGTWQTSSSGDGSFVSAARWEMAGLPPGHFISPLYEEFRTWGVTRTAGSDSHVSMVVNDRGTITIQIDGLNSQGQGKGTFALYGVR